MHMSFYSLFLFLLFLFTYSIDIAPAPSPTFDPHRSLPLILAHRWLQLFSKQIAFSRIEFIAT